MLIRGTQPRPELCRAIAKTLGTTLDEVYRQAGILPKTQNKNRLREKAINLFDQLSKDDKKDIINIMKDKLKRTREKDTDVE